MAEWEIAEEFGVEHLLLAETIEDRFSEYHDLIIKYSAAITLTGLQ